MKNEMLSQSCKQIKKQGYSLAQPSIFVLPHYNHVPTFLNSIITMFIPDLADQSQPFNHNAPKIISVLNEQVLIVAQSNKVVVLNYSAVNNNLQVKSLGCFLLCKSIRRIACSYKTQNDDKITKPDYFTVQLKESNCLTLFKVDEKLKINCQYELKEKDIILSMNFVSYNSLLLLMRNCQVKLYTINDKHVLKQRNYRFTLNLLDRWMLDGAQICSAILDGYIRSYVFYVTKNLEKGIRNVNLVEFQQRDSNIVECGRYYNILDSKLFLQESQQLIVYPFGDSFLLQNHLTILLVQKRFGKYFNTDAISKLGKTLNLLLIKKEDHMFICSIGYKEIQFWSLQLKEVGCICELLDVIQIDSKIIAKSMIKAWIFQSEQQPKLAFLMDAGGRTIHFYLTIRSDKLAKLVHRVQREQKVIIQTSKQKMQFKGKLKRIQEMGQKLGFNRRQFYYKLWQEGDKRPSSIFEYLLPCMDFKLIFFQITNYLKMKTLTVSELVRILTKIESSLLSQLEKKLNPQLIRRFLKTNFQRRKLRLYGGDTAFDFQKYQMLYESSLFDFIQKSIDLQLFPDKFKNDIIWKEQKQEQPIYIPYILRQFRLCILENYPQFLLTLLQPYKDCARTIIQTFPCLLPQYPLEIKIVREQFIRLTKDYKDQKIEASQYSWFESIRQRQWELETSSINFMIKILLPHYPTSFIHDQFKQFREGIWCKQLKYRRHVLVELSLNEFQAHLCSTSSATSPLFLCEHFNRVSLQEHTVCQTQSILRVMLQKNRLTMTQHAKLKLYCKLHHLLISEQLIDATTTIKQLMEHKNAKIVSYFFLGKRQKINLLFKEVALFYTSDEFKDLLLDYIKSEECSKVQLQILVNFIKKSNKSYQKDSQQMLEMIIIGFYKGIQIREVDKASDFLNLIRQLSLSEALVIKMSIFESIATQCYQILSEFNLSPLTYDYVINNPQKIIEKIVSFYFQCLAGKDQSLYIQGQQVNLGNARNIFVVVLYLKDKIYSYCSQLQIYIIFSRALITWNQFQLLQQCFDDDLIIDDNELCREDFFIVVIKDVLARYYQDETLVYTNQTKRHINELLRLIQKSNPVRIVEAAKIEFVEIFQEFDIDICFQYMQMIRCQWCKQQERVGIFNQIVDKFRNKLEFQQVIAMYQNLQKMRLQKQEIQIKTQQFIRHCQYFCRQLIKHNNFLNVGKAIYFLNQHQTHYKVSDIIMTEFFLNKLVNFKYLSDQLYDSDKAVDHTLEYIHRSKLIIDFYVSNYSQVSVINQTFFNESSFVSQQKLKVDGQNFIVDPQLTINKSILMISRQDLWESILGYFWTKGDVQGSMLSLKRIDVLTTAKENIKSESDQTVKKIFYCYFFITRTLENRNHIFQIQENSYQHFQNIMMLEVLNQSARFDHHIDFQAYFISYLKGLFMLYYRKLHQQLSPQELNQNSLQIIQMDKQKLRIIIEGLPQTEEMYLTKCMKKLLLMTETLVTNDNNCTKNPVYEPLHYDTQEYNFSSERQQQQQASQALNNLRTYKFIDFSRVKRQYAGASRVTSQKVIIRKVLGDLQQKSNQSFDSVNNSETEKIIVKQFFAQSYGQYKKEIRISDNLQNLSILQERNEVNSFISEWNSLTNLQYQPNIYYEVKTLLKTKNFRTLIDNYQTKIIIKVITDQYYDREISYNGSNEQLLSSKIMQILQILQNLNLYGYLKRIHILKDCLGKIELKFLFKIERYLIEVFKLNVLLNYTQNVKDLELSILDHIRSTEIAQFKLYEQLVGIIVSFLQKYKNQVQSLRRSSQQQDNNFVAFLYLQYIKKLVNSSWSVQKQREDLQAIVKLIGRFKLSQVHQSIIDTLNQTQLIDDYIVAVHRLFIPDHNNSS